MTGQQIGMFRLVRQQSTGGLGEVWLAEHVRTGRKAAVKLFSPHLALIPGGLERLFIELRATSLVRHPGMVEIYDCDRLPDGRGYIIREYLEGETLRECLARSGSFAGDMDAVRVIMIQLADVLDAAHEKGIPHLDLKPENIFLVSAADETPPIRVKLLDFGLANLAQRGTKRTAMAVGMTPGTARYLSPEQCRGTDEPDQRSDIYALGCILFEMLAGRPPFVQSSAAALLTAHMMEAPPCLRDIDPTIPAAFDPVVQGMLVKDPAHRTTTLGEVVAGVAAAANDEHAATNMTVMLEAPLAGTAPRRTVFLPPAAPSVSDLPPTPAAESATPRSTATAGATRILLPDEAPSTRVVRSVHPAAAAGATPARRKQTTTLSTTLGEATRPIRASSGRLVAGTVAAIALIGVLVVVFYRQSAPPRPEVASADTTAPAAPPAVAPPLHVAARKPSLPDSVTITVESDPTGARVFVADGDTCLGQTPLKVTRPRGGRIRLRVETPGYLPQEHNISLDGDAPITSHLKKRRPPRAGDDVGPDGLMLPKWEHRGRDQDGFRKL